MTLRELIEEIGRKYDPKLGTQSRAQRLLRVAQREISPLLPPGYEARGSGGRGSRAFVPWIAVFDPDETTSAQYGMYVVYLFAVDLGTVVLSLHQGVTELERRLGRREGRRRLVEQADVIRAALPTEALHDLTAEIVLPGTGSRPISYRAGNILARTYRVDSLPDNGTLEEELWRFIHLYRAALEVREQVRQRDPALIWTPVPAAIINSKPVVAEFKPKNDGEYLQLTRGRTVVKTRKHETLVRKYGLFLKGRGFEVATNVHPRDMVAIRGDDTWLFEAKVVQGNGMSVAREALAQLLFYRYLYHRNQAVNMVALFSKEVGDLALEFLQAHDVSVVWHVRGHWHRTRRPGAPPT